MKLSYENFFITYEYFYKRFYKNKLYTISKKNKEKYKVKIDKFKKQLVKTIQINSLGAEWFFKYYMFQFERLSKVNINRMDFGEGGRIIFDDITRKKSLDLFVNRNINFDYSKQYYDFSLKYNICLEDLIKVFQKTNIKKIKREVDYNYSEVLKDIERNRFLNKKDGYEHCMDNLIHYNRSSSVCRKCKFYKMCKV